MPAGREAPRAARQFLAKHTQTLPRSLREDAALLISELVTNAVLHGKPAIAISLATSATMLRVEVHDAERTWPRLASVAPAVTQARGRGLVIVDALATRWGVLTTVEPAGKCVWFELTVSMVRIAPA